MSEAVETGAPARPRDARWSFGRALLALLLLVLWAEGALAMVRTTQAARETSRLLPASGLFLALLPFFFLLIYRWRRVHGFFRSIEVGVVNLVLIGVGAVIGVLFQQEDPFQPAPAGAVARLAERGEGGGGGAWSAEERTAYAHYLSFRNAQAFFAYHLLGHLGLRGAIGFEGPAPGESSDERAALANLAGRLPELRERFGEEFAVAIETQSASGLRTRARNAEIADLEARWDDLWWTLFVWADRLDLRRAYRSDWYAVLWTVLFLGVLSNTFRGGWRRLLKPKMWGFVLTHAGVLAVIAGGAWGRFTEERGMMELHVGEDDGAFQRYDGGIGVLRTRGWFAGGEPFRLRLDDFRADAHDVLDVVFARRAEDGAAYPEFELANQPKLRVFAGKTAAYDWSGPGGEPRLRLEVLEYAKQARLALDLRAARAGEPGFPVVRTRIEDAGGAELDTGLLLPSRPQVPFVRSHAASGTRMRLTSVATRADAEDALRLAPDPRLGVLMLAPHAAADGGRELVVAVGARADWNVDGEDWSIEVLDATPDFRLRAGAGGALEAEPLEAPIELAEARNPAVLVRIRAAAGGEERRWVLEQDFHREDLLFPQLELSFRWDAWAAPAARRLAFFALDDGAILCGEVGDPASLREVAPGFALELGGGALLRVPEAFARGEVDLRFTQAEQADFYDATPPAIRLRITTPEGVEERVMSGEDGRFEFLAYAGPDGTRREVALRFREDRDQGELPVEWRSRLTVLVPDGAGDWTPSRADEVRVNDYFVHGGYRFFQTNHNPADPSYSGIGVVYDPGIELVLFGLYTVMFGTAVVFLIKPLFTRRHRGED